MRKSFYLIFFSFIKTKRDIKHDFFNIIKFNFLINKYLL